MVNTIMGYARDVGRTMTEWQPTKQSLITSIFFGTMDLSLGYVLYQKINGRISYEKFYQPLSERQYQIVGITFVALFMLAMNFVGYKLAGFIDSTRFFSEKQQKKSQNQLLEAIDKEPDNAKHYYDLDNILQEDFVDLLDGTPMSKIELLLKSIELDPDFVNAYLTLALELPLNGNFTLTLPNGDVVSWKELFLKVIELHPVSEHALAAYIFLAFKGQTAGNPQVTLTDGTVLSIQELCFKALELASKLPPDPYHAHIYIFLGTITPIGQKIHLPDGTDATCQDLYLKAIQLDPQSPRAYSNLARSLQPGSTIKLLDGTIASKKRLLLKAISLAPTKADYYIKLARRLPISGSVKLLDGKKYTKKQLLLKAQELDPKNLVAAQLLTAHMQALLPPAPAQSKATTPDP